MARRRSILLFTGDEPSGPPVVTPISAHTVTTIKLFISVVRCIEYLLTMFDTVNKGAKPVKLYIINRRTGHMKPI